MNKYKFNILPITIEAKDIEEAWQKFNTLEYFEIKCNDIEEITNK